MELDIEGVRRDLPCLSRVIHLNAAGLGPTLEPVTAEIIRLYRLAGTYGQLWSSLALEEKGPEAYAVFKETEELAERTRKSAAEMLGVSAAEIAFIRSMSEGASTIAYGLRWKPGDDIVITDQEHPSLYMVLLQLARRVGLRIRRLRLVDDRALLISRLERLLTARTKLIAVSYVTADLGFRVPVEDVCHIARQHGIPVFVDAAQATGQFPVNLRVLDCDFYCSMGGKWLLGPRGTGWLYVRRERLHELQVSWTGNFSFKHSSPISDDYEFLDTARRFEFGSRHLALYAALGVAVRYLTGLGLHKIQRRALSLVTRLRRGLDEIPGVTIRSPRSLELTSGIVSFSVDGYTGPALARELIIGQKILCRNAMLDTVRLSVGFYNTEQEIDTTLDAIRKLAAWKGK